MPITEFAELANTRTGTEDAREIRWRVKGTGVDDRDVFNYAIARIAELGLAEYDGMPQSEPLQIEHVRDFDPEYWVVTARYQRQGSTRREEQDRDTAEFKLSYQISGIQNTRTIFFAEETIGAAGRLKDDDGIDIIFDAGNALNLDEEDRPQGADVFAPEFTMTIQFSAPAGFLTGDYVRKCLTLFRGENQQAVVNDTPFPVVGLRNADSARGTAALQRARNSGQLLFEPGEVLFSRCDFPVELGKITTVTYEFLLNPNRGLVTIPYGDSLELDKGKLVIKPESLELGQVEGWNIVDVRYSKVDVPGEPVLDGKKLVKTRVLPHTAYNKRVYTKKNLNRLFLPGSQ